MPDFDAALARLRERIQAALDDFLNQHAQPLLAISPDLQPALSALSDMLRGGKRLRPAFCYWGFVGAGGQVGDPIIKAAAALELLQASALIHDDVMDNSDTRRGAPAVHRRFAALHGEQQWNGAPESFGAAAAILIGDLALVWTDAMLFDSGFEDKALRRAKPVFDAMRAELMAGQFLDVLEQSRGGGSVQRALRVMRFKTTAYTIERPLHLGAALAGAESAVLEAYTAFGVPLGEAFQLRDDVLGVFGDTTLTGKPAGDDVREGKRTILIALAQERGNSSQRSLLERQLGNPELDAVGLTQVQEVLRDSGALAEVELRIARNREAALSALQLPQLAGDAVTALQDLALAATDRSA